MAQMLILSSPARSTRVSTALLATAVGVYGCGVVAALLELAYTRNVAEATGEPLAKVVETASYTVDPVIEELIKVAPLLLVGWNIKIRRQWGLTDFVVLGAGLGAGFGLLEAVARYGLEAERAISHPAGGWIIPDSLRAPYVPGPEQVFSAWFPAPQGTLELGDLSPAAGTSPHLIYTALAALGVGVLLRARGWVRALGVLPLVATSALHMLTNYAAAHPTDRDAASRVDAFQGMLWAVPLVCLAVAMAADLWQVRRAKPVVSGVLLHAERAGRSGLSALAGYAAWCVPWSTLIALRFARLRRSLFYGVTGGAPYTGAEVLHRTVAWAASQIDASDREQAWRGVDLRAVLRAGGGFRDPRRRWFVVIALGLTIPALALLLLGSFPAAAEVQRYFGSGNGLYILVGFGIVGLLLTGWQLMRLLVAWRSTLALPHGEVLAIIRLRIWVAFGGGVTGVLLVLRLGDGVAPDGPVIRNLHLLDALNNFLAYLGFALMLLALLALFPPGGGLALATTGVTAGAVTTEAAIHAAALGTLGVVLMTAASGGSGAEEGSSAHAPSEGQGKQSGPRDGRFPSDETVPVSEEQQGAFTQSQQQLSGLSKRKQAEEVGKGFEKDGQKYKPEAPLLRGGKHGLDWSEGTPRAVKDGRPQGRFGDAADVKYATERGAELGPGKQGFFRLPNGHNCVEYLPDGTTRTPNSIFVKVYPNGKVHAYPLTR
ncbi:PrsW family intramembrane metalloprotease [Streptomyces sparsogenes]|uniref:PrsW family intramembrane metalloprotease n=1 Tax=Streptomyces sparsogenes TaxID=67365 RepID=UPI0033344F93